MDRVWGRAIFAAFSCLLIGLAVVSCQWLGSEGKQSAQAPPSAKSGDDIVVTGIETHDGAIQSIKRRGELRVGMQVGYVPFQMPGPGGSLVGFDVDAAQMTARALGVGLRVVKQSWEELIPSLLEGKTDLLISGMTITPERNLEVLFTMPVLETGRMFLVHTKNAERFKNLQDLDAPGVFVVSVAGGPGKLRARELLPRASFREFPDRETALNEVIQLRAHAYLNEEFDVRMACAKRPDILIGRFTPLTYEPIAWAVRPGDTHWLNWLNNFIQISQRDGSLDELKKKWLQDYYLDIVPRSK